MIFVPHVCQAVLWASVVMDFSVVPVGMVASEPFLESHRAHDIIIGHGVETVECGLYFLLWPDSGLEGNGDSRVGEPSPVHDLLFLETPWLEK